ncbi:unnamed protein product [Cladocopium goreaui]|uniref:Tetracycline resistance protein, class A n=1 Tax=Cladocopium goreaui TaxID=2562237 RepID=A0A9P1DQL5_9DINO|nr:unnamed protein product [Cladocopium goreaui]
MISDEETDISNMTSVTDSRASSKDVGKIQALSSHVCRMRHLLLLIGLSLCSHLIGADVPYIENTFFAQGYGGGDCEVDPKSEPCRRGAALSAEIFGWTHAAANLLAMVMAVFLGSVSDVMGRRPLVRAVGVANTMPLLAVLLHLTTGFSLWVYVVITPLVESFNINGVYLAIMSDSIEDPEERAAAFGTFMACSMLMIGVVMPFGFLLPRSVALVVSVVCAVLNLIYLFLFFPETSQHAKATSAAAQETANPLRSMKDAFRVISRNTFMLRLAVVLMVAGLGASGYAIVFPPFMMGYLGFTRQEKLILFAAGAVSALVTFGCLLGPLVRRLGSVRVLRISMSIAAFMPIAIALCQDRVQLTILTFITSGPLFMAIPLVSALKSGLVKPSEQGLIQGAIASIGKGASTLGFIIFSTIFGMSTKNGEDTGLAAVLPSFGTIALISFVALALACSLPDAPLTSVDVEDSLVETGTYSDNSAAEQ